jgi:class 3 adenylate cyclase
MADCYNSAQKHMCADRTAQAAQFAAKVPPINAAIGTVSNVASRLWDEAKPGQILISPRVLTKVENAVKVEPAGELRLRGSGGLWRLTMW